MNKAYNRIEWDFLFAFCSPKMGFCYKWVEWIWICVTMVSYCVLVNGKRIGEFKPMRNIKQDDPFPFIYSFMWLMFCPG